MNAEKKRWSSLGKAQQLVNHSKNPWEQTYKERYKLRGLYLTQFNTIHEKEAINLNKSKQESMERFGWRKGKESWCKYNLKR